MEKSISLVSVTIADVQEILKIQQQGFKEYLQKYQDHDTNPCNDSIEKTTKRLNDSNFLYYFIVLNSNKIGIITVYKNSVDHYNLARIVILPQFQNNGYGKKAIKILEEIHKNVQQWSLDTIKQEEKLNNLYKSLGYQEIGKTKKIKEGMDLIFYTKIVD